MDYGKLRTSFTSIWSLRLVELTSLNLKYIVFDEGNFARPHSSSNKYISLEFICAAHQYVKHYISSLPVIDGRPTIHINKLQVERTFNFYTYMETTMTMLFDASFVNPGSQIVQEVNVSNPFSKQYIINFIFFYLFSSKFLLEKNKILPGSLKC